MSFFSLFNPFAKPNAIYTAQQELAEARLSLLSAQSSKEWAESQVTYNTARINRLEKAVKELHKLGPVTYDMTIKLDNGYNAPASPPTYTSTEIRSTTKVSKGSPKPKGPNNQIIGV